eukprot:250667-Chlamydomonas_euryale.AAC.2
MRQGRPAQFVWSRARMCRSVRCSDLSEWTDAWADGWMDGDQLEKPRETVPEHQAAQALKAARWQGFAHEYGNLQPHQRLARQAVWQRQATSGVVSLALQAVR